MALINCPECKKSVSEHAHSCPHCGYAFRNGETANIKKQQSKNTRIAWVLIGFFFFWLIGKCSSDSTDDSKANRSANETEQSQTQEAAPPVPKKGVLFQSTGDFRQAFNSQSKSLGFDIRIDKLKVIEGEVQNTFTYKLGHELMMLGVVSKQNSGVKEVMLMMGSGASAVDFLSIIAVLIAVSEPALLADERGKLLDDLGFFNATSEQLQDYNKVIERNGRKYGFMSNEYTGVSFWISK